MVSIIARPSANPALRRISTAMALGDACDNDDDGDQCLRCRDDDYPLNPRRDVRRASRKPWWSPAAGPMPGNYLWPATEAMAEYRHHLAARPRASLEMTSCI